MITHYVEKKLRLAKYKILKDGTYFGEITGIRGVWANAKSLENCRAELAQVLEDWMLLKVQSGERIPGFTIRFDRRELVPHG